MAVRGDLDRGVCVVHDGLRRSKGVCCVRGGYIGEGGHASWTGGDDGGLL